MYSSLGFLLVMPMSSVSIDEVLIDMYVSEILCRISIGDEYARGIVNGVFERLRSASVIDDFKELSRDKKYFEEFVNIFVDRIKRYEGEGYLSAPSTLGPGESISRIDAIVVSISAVIMKRIDEIKQSSL